MSEKQKKGKTPLPLSQYNSHKQPFVITSIAIRGLSLPRLDIFE